MVPAFAADPVARWMYRDQQGYLLFRSVRPSVRRHGLLDRNGMVRQPWCLEPARSQSPASWTKAYRDVMADVMSLGW